MPILYPVGIHFDRWRGVVVIDFLESKKRYFWIPWMILISILRSLRLDTPRSTLSIGPPTTRPPTTFYRKHTRYYCLFFYVLFLLIVLAQFIISKSSFCHRLCWVVPFIMVSRPPFSTAVSTASTKLILCRAYTKR